jgi:hypothetical protein
MKQTCVRRFFRTHQCSDICRYLHLTPADQQLRALSMPRNAYSISGKGPVLANSFNVMQPSQVHADNFLPNNLSAPIPHIPVPTPPRQYHFHSPSGEQPAPAYPYQFNFQEDPVRPIPQNRHRGPAAPQGLPACFGCAVFSFGFGRGVCLSHLLRGGVTVLAQAQASLWGWLTCRFVDVPTACFAVCPVVLAIYTLEPTQGCHSSPCTTHT